jgi:hypothetical protein
MSETFVLIHGAWHTGEDFETIANILRDGRNSKRQTPINLTAVCRKVSSQKTIARPIVRIS